MSRRRCHSREGCTHRAKRILALSPGFPHANRGYPRLPARDIPRRRQSLGTVEFAEHGLRASLHAWHTFRNRLSDVATCPGFQHVLSGACCTHSSHSRSILGCRARHRVGRKRQRKRRGRKCSTRTPTSWVSDSSKVRSCAAGMLTLESEHDNERHWARSNEFIRDVVQICGHRFLRDFLVKLCAPQTRRKPSESPSSGPRPTAMGRIDTKIAKV